MTDLPVHPAWLPATLTVAARSAVVLGRGPVVDTVARELADLTHGVVHREPVPEADLVLAVLPSAAHLGPDATAHLGPDAAHPAPPADLLADATDLLVAPLGPEEFVRTVADRTVILAGGGRGLLAGLWDHVRRAASGTAGQAGSTRHTPAQPLRMLDHWDNMVVHPVMGQVERGYSGGSIFYADGRVRADLSRVAAYARLLGSIGINAVGLNNVNVGPVEARLLTEHLPDVARLAAAFRPHGVAVYLSVSFAAPMTVGGLATADPLDPMVAAWWRERADAVYAAVPDFGGFVVKADSEGQPGPFAYGRTHADGANMLAAALGPHGGTVFWRAFVYDHRQDWRDRRTDRASAAHDHFVPLDGSFADNVVLQVKHGPMDFQVREPVSPVIAAMPRTRLAVELQVTQEYTGHQRDLCYLEPWWSQILAFRPWGEGGPTVSDVAAGRGPGAPEAVGTSAALSPEAAAPSPEVPAAEGDAGDRGDRATSGGPTDRGDRATSGTGSRAGGLVAVSNVGDDPFWTGHPLAQANLYAFGRLAWDPGLGPAVLEEWVSLTFPGADAGPAPTVRETLRAVMADSWRTYEGYTAPLGVGFMVNPGSHLGPSVDGYEYSPWGTYHFADRDGVGVDRTRATGTGYTGQYPAPWRDVYEDLATCPDELLLFFHHVPYTHRLHSGTTVIQHIYDSRADAVEEVRAMARSWEAAAGRVPEPVFERVRERLAEQIGRAAEWRDQVRTYFWRKSGVPDAAGRPLY